MDEGGLDEDGLVAVAVEVVGREKATDRRRVDSILECGGRCERM